MFFSSQMLDLKCKVLMVVLFFLFAKECHTDGQIEIWYKIQCHNSVIFKLLLMLMPLFFHFPRITYLNKIICLVILISQYRHAVHTHYNERK